MDDPAVNGIYPAEDSCLRSLPRMQSQTISEYLSQERNREPWSLKVYSLHYVTTWTMNQDFSKRGGETPLIMIYDD